MPVKRSRPLSELNATIEPPQALPDRVYGLLKHRILTCTILPGQRLNEKEIADEFKVSRTPLREALNRLSQENLLTRIPYCGYAVTLITEDDIRELCESRLILETAAAGLAAERATPAELERMMQFVELRYTPGDRETYAQYLKANSLFHGELARASHNHRLEVMVVTVLDELQRPLYLGLDVGLDAANATQEHVLLVEAIKDRNPDRARRLQSDQITMANERIIAAMKAYILRVDKA
ncbi:GntR family transcriptional regulator [Singulisphaera sp. PoT]|uniref:GntR family transcriptional regulator n=1 Tax=Singulisphaera sp. PoT TaxID=3411797 RepID=UPI003BF48B3C